MRPLGWLTRNEPRMEAAFVRQYICLNFSFASYLNLTLMAHSDDDVRPCMPLRLIFQQSIAGTAVQMIATCGYEFARPERPRLLSYRLRCCFSRSYYYSSCFSDIFAVVEGDR